MHVARRAPLRRRGRWRPRATRRSYPSVTAGTVAPSAAAPAAAPLAAPQGRAKGVRRIPHSAAAAPLTGAPPAASSSLAAAPTGLVANFNGVGSRDSAVTNFGAEFEPPDQGLCVGNGFVVEMVNSAYTVYRPNGSVVTGPFNVNGPFNEGLTEFTTDPRCHYDAATNTWFAIIAFISADATTSHLDVAVNTSGDPDQDVEQLPDRHHRHGREDRAQASAAARASATSRRSASTAPTSMSRRTSSRSSGPEFNGAQIYAIAKNDLVALQPNAALRPLRQAATSGGRTRPRCSPR